MNAIRAVLGPRAGPPDFARLFQAVRIAVNDELGRARSVRCPAFRDALEPGGRLAVITYHSGEDRLVKHGVPRVGQRLRLPAAASRCVPAAAGRSAGSSRASRSCPSERRVAANPRARSAKLRIFQVGRCGLRGGTG